MIGIALVLGVAFLGTVGALFRPYWGIVAYVFFGLIRPYAMFPQAPTLPYSQLVVLCAAAGFAIHGFGDRRLGKAKIPLLAIFAYLAWDIVSAWLAPVSSVATEHVFSQLRIFIPCILAVLIATSIFEAKLLAWTIAVGQGMVAFRFNDFYYTLNINLPLDGWASKGRALWALDMLAGVTFCFFLFLMSRKLWQKVPLAVMAVVCLSAMFITFSRGGMLGLIATAGAVFFFLPKKPKYFGLYAIALVVVLSLAGPPVVRRFKSTFADSSTRDASASNRIEHWGEMAQAIQQNPVFGLGPNHYPLISGGREGHNHWLQLGAEIGLPALFALLLLYLYPLFFLWQLRRPPPHLSPDEAREVTFLAGAAFCSTAAFFVCSQFISIDLLEIPAFVATLSLVLLKVVFTEDSKVVPAEAGAAIQPRSRATVPHSG